MSEHLFESSLEVPVSVERTFAFFSDPRNLLAITPPRTGLRPKSALPAVITLGTRIDYRLRVLGIPLGWTTLISEWDPPRSFVDEQIAGPFAIWIHRHTLEPTRNGTLLRDRVRFRLPVWPLGELAFPLVKRQLKSLFRYRQTAIAALLSDAR